MVKKSTLFLFMLAVSVLLNLFLVYSYMNANSQLHDLSVYKQAYLEIEKLVKVGRLGEIHEHADFKVYVDGKELPLYTEKNILVNKFVHMHDDANDENVIHVEATGITLRHFFRTIGVELSRKCLVYEGESYCSTGNSTLKYYVNGALNEEAPDYYIHDKDKLLITYGAVSQSEIQKQLSSIGNNACIQSNNC